MDAFNLTSVFVDSPSKWHTMHVSWEKIWQVWPGKPMARTGKEKEPVISVVPELKDPRDSICPLMALIPNSYKEGSFISLELRPFCHTLSHQSTGKIDPGDHGLKP